MCEDKWNEINSDFKKFFYYHKGIGHHIFYWELTIDEHENFHLFWSFNREDYNVIEAFQWECIINTLLHVRNLHIEGDKNYITTIPIHAIDTHILMWGPPNPSSPSKFIITFFRHDGVHSMPQPSFTQELCSVDDVPKETIPIERPWMNVINLLDDYAESPSRPRYCTIVFNLFDAPSTCVITPQCRSATLITPRNTWIKWKQLNIFMAKSETFMYM